MWEHRQYILAVAAKHFTYAPRLRIAAAAVVRGIAVKYLAYRANTVVEQMLSYRVKQLVSAYSGRLRVAVYLYIGTDKSAEQKAPGCSLMIGVVAL